MAGFASADDGTILASAHYMLVAIQSQLALELLGIVTMNAFILENRLHPHRIKTGRVNLGWFLFTKPATQRPRRKLGQESLTVSQFAALIAGPDHQADGCQQGERISPSLPMIETPAGEARRRERNAAPHEPRDERAFVPAT